MAIISERVQDGPQYTANIHLNNLYLSFPDDQQETLADGSVVPSNYNLIDIYIEEFAFNSFNFPNLDNSLGIQHYVILKSNLWRIKETGLPEYSIRIQLNHSYYKVTMKLGENLDESDPGATIYSKNSEFTINNGFNWLYTESFKETLDDNVTEIYSKKSALFVFGNVLPIGGTTDDIQVLISSDALCQEFAFNDFFLDQFYSASFDSLAIMWSQIQVTADTYTKYPLSKALKNFLVQIINIPGVADIIKTKQQQLTSEMLDSLYGITAPSDQMYIPFSFIHNNNTYHLIFIGDFTFINNII